MLYRNPRAFEDKFTNAAVTSTAANNARKLPSIRRNFSAMRNPAGTCFVFDIICFTFAFGFDLKMDRYFILFENGATFQTIS